MVRNLEQSDFDKIINFGAFGYGNEKMSFILELPLDYVDKEMKNKDSVFYKKYQTGSHKSDYVLDLKLFEMAQGGDLKALEEYEFRKKKRLSE